ncbi:MAG: DUF2752 domain-containing protein [Planctomycetes bacterium]|nr:DUF2752 domain-containing protein [Planctomycetota bacterium]
MATDENVLQEEPYEAAEESVDDAAPIRYWARAILIGLTVPWILVFAVAIRLDPYENGEPRRMGTHMQIAVGDQNLPDCNFKTMAGVPCPSCGMTTSFSLLVHADVWNSLKANFAGTGLATFGMLFIPWAFASAFFGRFVFVRSLELVVFWLAAVFLAILFGRWVVVIVLEFLT